MDWIDLVQLIVQLRAVGKGNDSSSSVKSWESADWLREY